jgi:hypothetical protein
MIKVEKVQFKPGGSAWSNEFHEYVVALRDLKVGESFLYKMESHHRLAIAIMQHAFGRAYKSRKEGGSGVFRIGRIE